MLERTLAAVLDFELAVAAVVIPPDMAGEARCWKAARLHTWNIANQIPPKGDFDWRAKASRIFELPLSSK